jgi:hypothetical protein
MILKQVIERYHSGNLPYINEDQIVEFPQAGGHKSLASQASSMKNAPEDSDFGGP